MAEDKIKSLYDAFVNDGYEMEPLDEFRKNLADGKKRRAAYDALVNDGYDMEPFDEFESNLGFSAATQPYSWERLTPTPADMVERHVRTAHGSSAAPQDGDEQPQQPAPKAQQKKVNRNAVPEWKLRAGMRMAGIGSDGKWQSRVANPGHKKNMQRVSDSLKMDDGKRAGIGVNEQAGRVEMQNAPKLISYTPDVIVNQIASETGGNQGSAAVQRVREQMPEHYEWLQNRMGDDADNYIMKLAFFNAYGDDPDNFVGRIMDRYDRDNTVEQVWQDAEDAARKEYGEYLDERNRPGNFLRDIAGAANVTGGLGGDNIEGGIEAFASHMKYHDLQRMADAAWDSLGGMKQRAIISDIQDAIRSFYPSASESELWDKASDMARQYSDQRMYEHAVAMNIPKSATEYFFRKAGLGTSFGKMIEAAARTKAGTRGDMLARDEAGQRYEKQGHKVAGIAGTVASMAADPLTYAAGGIGSLATRGTMWLGGRFIGEAAMRRFATTLGGRMLGGAIGGSANLGTFMGGSEAFEQARLGGHRNEFTGGVDDYSGEAVMGSVGHGAMMGLGTGIVAPMIGNVSDKIVRATKSTAGKAGVRAGEFVVSTVAEGTIFSIPEWIEGKRSAMDVWTDNMAMMAGFKVSGLIKSAPQRIEELRKKDNPQNMAERNHNRMSFQERLRNMFDGRPDLALTADEKAELENGGYGDLKGLVDDAGRYKEAQEQQKALQNQLRAASERLKKAKKNYDKATRESRQRPTETSRVRFGNASKELEQTQKDYDNLQAQSQALDAEFSDLPYSRFAELMNDGNVSEAARAKMYYYLTGEQLPMSTITGYNYSEHKDANGNMTGYTVESIGANGVITSRSFKSKGQADAEVNRIIRQAELNTIDMGEQHYNSKYETRRMYEACRRMSEKTGVPTNKLYELIQKMPEDLSDIEARWAEEVFNEYESLSESNFTVDGMTRDGDGAFVDGGHENVKGLPILRNEISEAYDVDLDAAIRKEPSQRSEREQAAVKDYIERLYEDVEVNRPEAAEANPVQKLIEASYTDGYDAPEETHSDLKMRFDAARQRLKDLGFTDGLIESLENPDQEWLNNLSDDARSAALEYLGVKAAYEGMLDHVDDNTGMEVAQSDAMIDEQTNPDTGRVQRATLKTGGEVFIVGGEVVVDSSTGEIDLEKSTQDLIVFNPATGKKEMIHVGDLASADEATDAQQVKQQSAEIIQQTMAQAAADRIDGVIQAGGEYDMLSDDNMNYHVKVLEKRDDGTVLVQVDGVEEPVMLPQEIAQQWVDNARAASIAAQAQQEPVTDEVPEQEVPVDEVPIEEEPTEEVPTAENEMQPVDEQPVIEEEEVIDNPMPVDDNGDVDWLATTPERGYEHLYNENGLSQEEADEVVKNSIADAEATLKKVSGKKPKPTTAAQLPKYNADKAAYEAKVAAAQAAVDYWNGVKAVRDQLQAELVRAQAEERARMDAEARAKAAEELKQQQAEQAAKRAEAEERGPFKAGIAVIDKWDNAPKVDGVRDQITLADGTAIPGHYLLVEAGAATPSHDPSTGWKASEGFPVDENGGTVNDRDYERDQAAQEITIRMSETYDSRAAQSVPVVTSDGVVLSGNGRTIAGDLAAQANTDGAYIDYLKEYGGKYGFNAEQVSALQHPRVLFIPDEKMPYTAETFAKFNAQEMKGQNLTETAVKLGKTVDDVTFNDVIGLINQFDTMSQFYSDESAPTQAITMLLRGGVINPMQHAQMFDGDKVSTQGEEMLENLLLGKAFEGNPDAIRQLMSMPSVRQQVVSALAEIANNAALGDYSLENELSQAIALVEAARRGNIKQGDTVSNYARQMSLFPEETGATVADYRNAMVLILGDILNGRGKNTLKNLLTLYNQHAADAAAGVGDLFTGGVKTPEDILKEAVEFIKNSSKNELKQELKQAVEQRKEGAAQPAGEQRGSPAAGEQTGPSVEGSEGRVIDAAVEAAEQETDTNPSDGQKEAGNYKKGHVKVDGYDFTVENPKGSERSGTDKGGNRWSVTMHNTYGYIRGTEGVDGDHIDMFLSDHLDDWNGMVYVVDQVNQDGSFDEHKVMYGFDSEQEAREAYLSNYKEGWTGLGNITGVSREEFKKWVDSSHRKTKPFAEYKSVKVSRPIQGLEGYTEDEILADVRAFIEEQLEDAGIEGVTIKGMALHGSRMRGDARPDSDLDVVVEYDGDISEDAFFNLVNYDLNFRGPNGVIIDINPITRGKSGTLEQYMERSRRYDEEKRAAAAEATEPVQSTGTGDQAYTITPTKYTTKKGKELDVWLVKFDGEIDKQQATDIAKETRGWWDREQGGFLMRSEEAARDLAERVAGATSQSDALPEPPAEDANKAYEAAISAEVVVRDSKGNVIPLSKRFDFSQGKRLGNIQFSKTDGNAEPVSEREAALRDALIDELRKAGIKVITDNAEAQSKVEAANRAAGALSEMRKRNQQQETALPEDESSFKGTAISSADGAKVIQNLESGIDALRKIADGEEEVPDAMRREDLSQYGGDNSITFLYGKTGDVSKNFKGGYGIAHIGGKHGADTLLRVLNVIANGKIDRYVAGNKTVILTDGEYEVVLGLTRFGNKETWLFNGWKKDEKTGADGEVSTHSDATQANPTFSREDLGAVLSDAKIQSVFDSASKDGEKIREHRVWHGSGAEFDAFDHSHMGEGEGAQAYGWGTYVTEVEDIGRRYAETAGGVRYKGHDVDELYEHSIDGMEDSERNAAWMLSRAMRTFGFSDAVERLRSLYKQDLENSNRLKGLSIEQTMERYGCSRADAKRYIKDAAAKADMWQQRLDALEGMREEDFTAPSRVLYEVEIPEEAGAVYLDHVALMKDQPDVLESVDNALTAQGWRRQEIDDTPVFTKGEKKIILSDGLSGGELYLVLEGGLGSDRAASEFLHEAGVTGIVYPSNYLGGGNRMGSKNYVIFDENDAIIVGKEKYFLTKDGSQAYGFTYDGDIYVDPEIATSETPVHEYSHLWAGWLRKANPKAWARLCEVILKQKDVLDYVKRLYPDLEGDDLVEEVFTHYSGRRGAERLRREEEAEMAKANGIFNKARIKVIFDQIRQALSRFWEMSRDLFAGKVEGIEKLSAEDFADMALSDLLGHFNGNENTIDKAAVKQRQERTLMGVHNITPEKLRSALKLGGLANPSMAVIDTSVSGFDNFGEISLIPDADLIASREGRNAGTWGADAYSPRFPETHRRLGKGGDKKRAQWVQSLKKQGMRKEMVFNTDEQFNDYYNSFNIRDNALVYPFLFEKGLADEVDFYIYKDVDTRLEDDLREANGDQFVLLKRFDEDDEYKQKITDIIIGDEVRNISRKDGETFQEFRDRRREWAKDIRDSLTEENGYVSRYLAEDLLFTQARAYRENGTFSESRTHANAEDYIRQHGMEEEYQQYFEQKMQELGAELQMYAGSDREGRSKFKAIDLESVSKQMKKQGRAGGEGGIFDDSPGAVRAKLLNPMKTLDQIRKEKGRIVGHEEFEQARQDYQDELRDYADRYTRGSSGALADILTSGNMAATARQYNIALDADAIADLNEFKDRIRQLPTEYFETKFERPVMLEEFRKAVVPDDLPLDLWQALADSGLELVEYKAGDKEDRKRVMLETTKEAPGIRFHFVGEKGATQADKSDNGNRMENKAIAEQMEQAGKDARNIKLATGWERGKDGKWRYEIMDFDEVNVIGNLAWLEAHPDAERARQLLHKLNANLFGMGEPLTQEERAEYASIVEKYHGTLRFDKPFKNPDRLTLEDYVRDDELFAAYPELRKMPVKFEAFNDETRGIYRPQKREIAVSVKFNLSNDGFRNVLLHEVQHAIQHIEGFASGSSEQLVKAAYDNIKGVNQSINVLADLLGYHDWIKTLTPEKLNAADDLKQKGRWFNLMYVFAKDNFVDPNERDKFIEKLDKANDVIAENKQVTGEGLTPYQAYRGAAGEVEARNVQSRSNMSREERRVSPAENTEDFPRDKQTVWIGFNGESVFYDIRREPAPKKTGVGYKVFVLKDGKLYPPMVANPGGEATPVGVWLNADAAPVAGLSKTGRQQVKAGGKGTQGGSGKLAYRPGWHLGEIPYALQFNRKNPETGEKELFPANFVWAEVEYADDVDYQDEAMSYGNTDNGKFNHALAGLPRVPENGSYRYRTNPNPETDPWIITGAMKVNRILKPSEVDQMVRDAGREPQKRQTGAVTDEQVDALNQQLRDNIAQYNDAPDGSVASETGNVYHTKDGKQVVYRSLFEDLMPEGSLFSNQQEETQPTRPMTDAERIQAMSDEELLRQVSEGDVDTGERNFYSDEYDRRHNQEYFRECDRYRQMLEDSNTTEDQAEEMLLDIIRDWRDKFNTPERTTLLAQFDTINDYYSEKVEDRMRREEEEEWEREQQEELDEQRREEAHKEAMEVLARATQNRDERLAQEASAQAPATEAEPEATAETPKSVFGRPKGRRAQFDPTEMSLRKLEEGEMSNVERRYVESQQFDFTGTDKIESAADVAYIFRQLETSAVENCFLVLIKDGRPTILHIGMGGYAMTVANIGSGVLAASALNPDTVIMLHNHPSGQLKPSAQDISLHKKVVRMFGEDKVEPSIIIDITSGKYAMFTDSELVSEQRPTSAENEVSHQVYSFSQMVFSEDWNPETAFQVKNSEDVAAFVSSHRLGDHDKVSLIVVDHAKHIVGNIFLPWTSLNDKDMREVADQVAKYTHQMGGSGCILYGSGMDLDAKNLKKIKSQLSAGDIMLVDCISVENGRNKSYNDYGMMNEPGEDYSQVNEAHDPSGDDLDSYTEGRTIYDGLLTNMMRAAADNKATATARAVAMRELGGNLSKLRQAMSLQREYDRGTVNRVVQLAKDMMDSGLFKEFSRTEVKRLVGLINNAAGNEDISWQLEKVFDMLQDHEIKEWENLLHKLMSIRGSKLNAQGVQVQGQLDKVGQIVLRSMKDGMQLDAAHISQRIADCIGRMGDDDPVVAKNAQYEYEGLLLANRYVETIQELKQEAAENAAELRREQERIYEFYKVPVLDENGEAVINKTTGQPRMSERKRLKPEFRRPMTDENKAIREHVEESIRALQQAERAMKGDMVEAYKELTDVLGAGLGASVTRAKEWREAQVEHANEITHNINSDIKDRPAMEQPRDVASGLLEPTVNNTLLKAVQLPAQTFEKLLRYLSANAYNGEGYLFNRFIKGYMEASNQEFERRYEALQILDNKVKEVFGGQKIRRAGVIPVKVHLWRQLYNLEKDHKRFPPVKVSYWSRGQRVDDELEQGEALYFYMVNKMEDGKMKLRRMGISEEDVEAIRQQLDPRFIELADWLQDDFLPSRRALYSEVYERMYGAPMPAVENYVHLMISEGSLERDDDINNYAFDATNPSTVTGSVIKRTRNTKPIDIHTDVFDLIARDIDDMEHWAAFAEYNRDLNILRNYSRLRNALKNVHSVEFGGGKEILRAFDDACAVVAGSYRPALYHSKVDKWSYEFMRTAVTACVNLKNFTALKQLLSIPSFWSEASAEELAKHTNPVTLIGSAAHKSDWEWAMENLPGFRKRWLSRQMGDPRMLKSDLGLSRTRSRIAGWFSRYGMFVNASIDCTAVATGARAVYETRKKQYLKDGYSEDQAHDKAIFDAWVAYNNSQQSTEGPFVSPVQLDKTSQAMLLTMFRTASMGYSRKNQTAARNLIYRLKNMLKGGDYDKRSIDFMKTLYEREGLGEDQAQARAERVYNRGKYKSAWDMVIYSVILTMLWNFSKKFLQVVDCDDDDERDKAWRDILAQTVFGPVEGWIGGDVMSDVGTLLLTGEKVTSRNATKEHPFMSEFGGIIDEFGTDKYEAVCACVNLATVTLTGVNPQVVSDIFVSVTDAFNGDFDAEKEFWIAMYRLNQFPQSQIDQVYIDELGIWGKDIKSTDMETLAKRYASYMRHRNAPYLDWARDEEAQKKADDRYIQRIDKKVRERMDGKDIEWLESAYDKGDEHLKKLIKSAIEKRVKDIEDSALAAIYDTTTNAGTKSAARSELARRIGYDDPYDSPKEEYEKIYNRIKLSGDLEDDIALKKAQDAAESAGDEQRAKAIKAARTKLTKEYKKQLTGGAGDEDVMDNMRRARKALIDEYCR